MAGNIVIKPVPIESTMYGMPIHGDPKHRSALEHRMVERWRDGFQWEPGECKVCGDPLEDDVEPCEALFPVTVCERCTALVDAHYDGSAASSTPVWGRFCPPLYREIDPQFPHRYPDINWTAYRRVVSWEFNRRGLVVTGDTGFGKSTALWHLVRRLEAQGVFWRFHTGPQFAREAAKIGYRPDSEHLDVLIRADVLVIDDLGKEKLTKTVASILFEVVNARSEYFRPTIISTRFSGHSFKERFDSEAVSIGTDLARRLGRFCDVVEFGYKNNRDKT